MNALLGNWRTTLAGLVAAVILYLNQAGMNLPTDWAGVKASAIAAAIAWLGAQAKDASTGSPAK